VRSARLREIGSMPGLAKRLRAVLIVASYVLVAAIAAAGGAQLMKQWAPGYSMPKRGEFARRLDAHSDSAAQKYHFFYATTRPAAADLLTDAAAERSVGLSLSLGSFDARIATRMRVQPLIWEDQEFLEVLPPQHLDPDTFFDELKTASARSPHRSVLIMVWGWKERWATAAAKSAYLSYMLDIDTPVIAFDWPANQGTNARGYLAAQEAARASGAELGRFIESTIERVHPENLWLVALSMGGQVVSDAFDYMAQRPSLNDAEKEIAHVVLAAPDVAGDEFDRKFAAQISRLSRHLTVYVSSTDQALLLSQWLNRRSRVGRVVTAQPEGPDKSQFEVSDRLLTLKAAGSAEIEVVDVTPINRHRNLHHFLTDDPQFLDELYLRLLRPTDPVSRRLYAVRTTAGVSSWILWDE
jgi:esterase/lipase superfamily enzyme